MGAELVVASGEGWAERIATAWQKSVDAIFETGRLIADAKAALPHGEFTAMIESALPFGASTAQRLMVIARDEKLSNPAHVQHLPPSWGTLYELTKLDTETFQRRINEGTIRSDMQRRDVATGGARAIMASREQGEDSLDYFPTPPWATRALVQVVMPALGVGLERMVVSDPACGEGHITGVLAEYPRIAQVIGTDIKDYSLDGLSAPGWQGCVDFLDPEAGPGEADWVITNPPFGERTLDFALRAFEVARKGVALFVRQQWLEGVDRYERLFSVAPPTLYAQFAERVNLCEGRWDPFGSTATAYCWLVWVKDKAPCPPFWIPPGQRKAFFLPDDVQRFTHRPVLGAAQAATGQGRQQDSQESAPEHDGPPSGAFAPAADDTGAAVEAAPADINAIIREGYARNASIAELCELTGLGRSAVKMRAKRMNLSDPERQKKAARRLMAAMNAERGAE